MDQDVWMRNTSIIGLDQFNLVNKLCYEQVLIDNTIANTRTHYDLIVDAIGWRIDWWFSGNKPNSACVAMIGLVIIEQGMEIPHWNSISNQPVSDASQTIVWYDFIVSTSQLNQQSNDPSKRSEFQMLFNSYPKPVIRMGSQLVLHIENKCGFGYGPQGFGFIGVEVSV